MGATVCSQAAPGQNNLDEEGPFFSAGDFVIRELLLDMTSFDDTLGCILIHQESPLGLTQF